MLPERRKKKTEHKSAFSSTCPSKNPNADKNKRTGTVTQKTEIKIKHSPEQQKSFQLHKNKLYWKSLIIRNPLLIMASSNTL